jgi:hypothetical protein
MNINESKKQRRHEVDILLMGVIFGVFGNLAANAIDRVLQADIGSFGNYLWPIIFLGSFFWFSKYADKKLGE